MRVNKIACPEQFKKPILTLKV
uniref:Uncharacterized protein n=1 Tax=Rhizophora mucronata TaxID=61149 RepID=A0A2P2QNK3_RHIMU